MLLALAAYAMWGLLPLYWKALSSVDAWEVASHRVLWSLLFTAPLVWRLRLSMSLLDRSLWLSAAMIGCNWIGFVWAVHHNYVLECSLGYFISPLLSVLLGVLWLGEKLSQRRRIAVGLATLGVLVKTLSYGRVPWIALGLATTFALYGLLRKTSRHDSLSGLCAETALLSPLAIAALAALYQQGRLAFGPDCPVDRLGLLIGTGPATALPLLCFAAAARRLPLSTLGLFQYVAPSLQFLLAVLVFQEPLHGGGLASFALIWSGLILFASSRS